MSREPRLDLHSTCPDIGMRGWYLEHARDLEAELGFSTSNFTTLASDVFDEVVLGDELTPEVAIRLVDGARELGKRAVHPEIIEHYARSLEPILPGLQTLTNTLDGDRIIVRPSPIDEFGYGHLSFAGVYKSYMPMGSINRETNLLMGTASVLAGRFTKYGNCYYERQGIDSERRVGIMYMQPFFDSTKDTPLFHGTAYIADGHIRNEYVIAPPMDRPQRDPRLMTKRDGLTAVTAPELETEKSVDYVERMTQLLEGLEEHFKAPLDVEYLMDKDGSLYVVQIRRISERHLANWRQIPKDAPEDLRYGSAILNSVGVAEGRVVDLRQGGGTANLHELSDAVVLINHEDLGTGVHTQAILEQMRIQRPSGMKVVVDHGPERVRDHLQYVVTEDPGIEFAYQTSDQELLARIAIRSEVRIDSNGLSCTIE